MIEIERCELDASEDRCVICGAELNESFSYKGCNPAPIINNGKCCRWCDEHIVVPTRTRRSANGLDPYKPINL